MKHAAQLSVGPSVNWMTVPRIGKFPKLGASLEINVPLPDPVANPRGREETDSMYARYSSAFAKSGRSMGVSLDANTAVGR